MSQVATATAFSDPPEIASSPKPSRSYASQSTIPKRDIFPLIAGGCAGMFAKTFLQPLDLVKTRLQVQDVRKSAAGVYSSTEYRGLVDGLRKIVRSEGLSALYTGLMPSLFGSGMSWAAYFFTYNQMKKWFASQQQEHEKLGADKHLISAAAAGSFTTLITNPVWMIKTRIQIQKTTGVVEYKGGFDCLAKIIRDEGILTLYRGIGPALLLVSNGAIQFMCYEELKHYTATFIVNGESNLQSHHFLVMGALSKMTSATLTYPLQVAKSRLYQKVSGTNQLKYKNMRDVISSVYTNERIRGFYKGLVPQLIKTVPSSGLTFLGYETMIRVLNALVE